MFQTLKALDLMKAALVLHDTGYQTNCLHEITKNEGVEVKLALLHLLRSSRHIQRCLIIREADVVIAIREITCLH